MTNQKLTMIEVVGNGIRGIDLERKLKYGNPFRKHRLGREVVAGFIYKNHRVSCDKYNVVIMPLSVFSREKRTLKNIKAKADELGLLYDDSLPDELPGILCEQISSDICSVSELYVMHNPHYGERCWIYVGKSSNDLHKSKLNDDLTYITDDVAERIGVAFISPKK